MASVAMKRWSVHGSDSPLISRQLHTDVRSEPVVENLSFPKVPDLFGKIDIISERVRITYKQGV